MAKPSWAMWRHHIYKTPASCNRANTQWEKQLVTWGEKRGEKSPVPWEDLVLNDGCSSLLRDSVHQEQLQCMRMNGDSAGKSCQKQVQNSNYKIKMRRKSCKYLKQFCFVHWLDARGTPFHAQHPGGFPSPSKGRATNGIPKNPLWDLCLPQIQRATGSHHHWISDGMLNTALHPKAHPTPAFTAPERTGVRLLNAHSDKNTSFFTLPFKKFYLKVKKPSQHERLDKHSSFPQQKLQKCLWICFGKKQCFLWKSFIEKSQVGMYSSILHF